MQAHFLVIGNLENRRVNFFQQACLNLDLPPPHCLSYEHLLQNPQRLQEEIIKCVNASKKFSISSAVDQFDTPQLVIVRLESPGENFTVEKLLIAAGENKHLDYHDAFDSVLNLPSASITAANALLLNFDKGIISYQRQWYLGYDSILKSITHALNSQQPFIDVSLQNSKLQLPPLQFIEQSHKSSAASLSSSSSSSSSLLGNQQAAIHIFWMNHPHEVAKMFDKRQTHQLLSNHGIPVPTAFYNVTGYDDLRQVMKTNNMRKVFVKIAHGSSASGVWYDCVLCFKKKNNCLTNLLF